MHRQHLRRLSHALLGTAALLALSDVARAEVETDGRLGARVRLTGPDIEVGARLGQVRGRNLFHSFERFDVETGGRVTFTGPGGLDNVIGRVTGGNTSVIDGTLASTVPNADVWLVNPAGILFGPNARLDVPGSFHASTADELRFADGEVFSALDPDGSVLSTAAPEAFGFLGQRPAAISLAGAVLQIPQGEALSLTGGDITLLAGSLFGAAADVTIASFNGAGSAAPATGSITGQSAGNIAMTGGSVILVTGEGGGTVLMQGGEVVVDGGAAIISGTSDLDAAGGIALTADTLRLAGGARIANDSLGAGQGGPIALEAREISLADATVRTIAAASGSAGNLTVAAGTLAVTRGGVGSLAGADSTATARAGNLDITADRIDLAQGNLFSSAVGVADNLPDGQAGRVTIRGGSLTIAGNGGVISATQGSGDAGTIDIEVASLGLSRAGLDQPTGISTQAGPGSTGDAGTVRIVADRIRIEEGATIESGTFGPGTGGTVSVDVGTLDIVGDDSPFLTGISTQADGAGQAGMVEVNARTVRISDGGEISSNTGGDGDAGTVRVTADNLELRRGGNLTTVTTEGAAGDGGALTVTAGRLLIDGGGVTDLPTTIGSQTEGGATGDAGRVQVTADTVELRRGGSIASSTTTTGDGGTVMLDAGSISIEGGGSPLATGILARGSAGPAGSIDVTVAGDLDIAPGGIIDATTTGLGRAGDVKVRAGRVKVRGTGSPALTGISSQASRGAPGDAGSVTVEANLIDLGDLAEIGSSALGMGEAGDVTLLADRVLLDRSGVLTRGTGSAGGRIFIRANELVSLRKSEVTSSGIVPLAGASLITIESEAIALNGSQVTSLTGDGAPLGGSGEANLLGDVTVISIDSLVAASSSVVTTGLQADLGSDIQVAAGDFLDADSLLGTSCAARRAGQASSFTRTGSQGGLPPSPDRPLPSAASSDTTGRVALHADCWAVTQLPVAAQEN